MTDKPPPKGSPEREKWRREAAERARLRGPLRLKQWPVGKPLPDFKDEDEEDAFHQEWSLAEWSRERRANRSAYDTALMHARRAEAIGKQLAQAEERGDSQQVDALHMAKADAEAEARTWLERAKAEGEAK